MMPDTLSQPACVILAEEVWGSALHAMRSLGRAGVPVYVATAGHGAEIYGRSRYCAAAADFDRGDPERLSSALLEWVRRLQPGPEPIPIIPLSDRLVDYLDFARESLPAHLRLGIPPSDIVHALLSKEHSLVVADRAGLDIPRWVLVGSSGDVETTDTLRLPVAVRPTRWSTIGDIYFKIEVFRERTALREAVARMLARGAELIVQEYVEAADDAVEFGILWRSRDRSVTAVCTGRKRRQASASGGVMIWGETADLPDVREAAARFLDESGFTGLGGIEFIRSQGRLWFIEFNPRLEAIHFLAAKAGLDTVLMAYRELAFDELPPAVPAQKPAAAWVGSACLGRLMANPSYWSVFPRDCVRFRLSPGRVRAVWTWGDPGPGLAVAARLLRRGLRAITRLGRSAAQGAQGTRP